MQRRVAAPRAVHRVCLRAALQQQLHQPQGAVHSRQVQARQSQSHAAAAWSGVGRKREAFQLDNLAVSQMNVAPHGTGQP